MPNIRLELEKLDILVKRRKWKLYFLIVAEHPDEPDKMVLTTIPSMGQDYFQLKKQANKQFLQFPGKAQVELAHQRLG
jgi:hypothetical protein